MTFDYSKLRGKIVEKYGTISRFANAMGTGAPYLSRVLINGLPFKTATVYRMASKLGIVGEIESYFFCSESSKKRTESLTEENAND